MTKLNAIQLFENKKVRTVWDAEHEKWFISIIDVIEVLTGSERSRKYWSDLKKKLEKEGSRLSDNIGQLKIQSSEGKFYKTDVADVEQLFRFIQSVPSPKAWSDKTTKEYKILKGLKKENLRDNMTNTELILNMLAEASAKDISQAVNPETFEGNKIVAAQGGNVAKVARKELEAKTGKKVVTEINAKSLLNLRDKDTI